MLRIVLWLRARAGQGHCPVTPRFELGEVQKIVRICASLDQFIVARLLRKVFWVVTSPQAAAPVRYGSGP